MNANDLIAIAPLAYVIGLASVVVLVDVVRPRREGLVAFVAVAGVVVGLAVTLLAGSAAGGAGIEASEARTCATS